MLQFIVLIEPIFRPPQPLMRCPRLGQFDVHVEIFAGQFRDDTENQAMKINDFLTLEIIIAGGSFIGAVIVLGVTYYFFFR